MTSGYELGPGGRAVGFSGDALDSSLTPTQLVLRWYPALVDPVQHAIVREPLVPADGWLDVPTGPGLGIDIDEAALERLAVEHFSVA